MGAAVLAVGLAGALLAVMSEPAARGDQVEKFPVGTIVKIEFEGTSISPEKIKPKLLSRVGHATQPREGGSRPENPARDQMVF